MRALGLVALLTLLLGVSVAVAWGTVGGSTAFRGPLPALEERWPAIYALVAVFAAAIAAAVFGRFGRALSPRLGALIVGAAWIGQWLVLSVAGWAIANELTGDVSGTFWVLGTGGPIQPFAAIVGLVVARRIWPPATPA